MGNILVPMVDKEKAYEENGKVSATEDSEKDFVEKQSLTQSFRKLLNLPAKDDDLKRKDQRHIEQTHLSVYELASQEGLSVVEWVQRDPTTAVEYAENSCAYWQNILTTAAMTGALNIPDENGVVVNYTVSKNQTKLIELRVREALRQLDYINELALTSYRDDEQRRDALQRVMYRRALKGDTRMAIYLHDRTEGRPSESKVAELDYDYTYAVWAILKTLFDKQLEVLNSGSGVRLICCSRRAGKTHLLVAIMLIECLRKPRMKVMYIGETMELSVSLVDKAANDIIDAAKLKDKRGRRLDWKHLDNGSEIMVRGLSNTKDPDQIRGHNAKIIVIDEFFHLKSELLDYMQKEVLTPMQMDYADDYMFICAGTPPRIKGTYGEKAWNEWNVPKFHWTWKDNPHPVNIEARTEFVENALREKGLTWESSFARREYLGEFCYDDDLLLYPDYYCYDPREAMPDLQVTRVLFGIDYGVSDNDCLIGVAWNDDEQRGYVFCEEKFNRFDVPEKVSQLEVLCEKVQQRWYQALDFFPGLSKKEANKRIWFDADDNDQHLTDYLNMNVSVQYIDEATQERRKLNLGIQNAHKTDKGFMFDRLNDVFRKGDLLVIKGSKLELEMKSTIRKRGPKGEVFNEVDDKAYHPDLLPALRYAMWNVIGVKGV